MKYFKPIILLVVLMIVGIFSGVCASTVQDNNKEVNMGTQNTADTNNPVNGVKTIYVAKNGTDRNDGLTQARPKRNIWSAINAAKPGDIIRVAPGTYADNLQINKNITLIGNEQNNTLIDGQQKNNCIRISSGITVTIKNFTLKNGNYHNTLQGGGIYNEGTLTLKDSTITDNRANYGGGIYNIGAMNIKGVIIKNNIAKYNAGGIHNGGKDNCGTLTMEDSTITNNTSSGIAGGICNNEVADMKNVTIRYNNATKDGGGIINNGELNLEDSTITNNIAGNEGGGIRNSNLLRVYGSTISYNIAKSGGGVYNSEVERVRAYIDDITVIVSNTPNNFQGTPLIPA